MRSRVFKAAIAAVVCLSSVVPVRAQDAEQPADAAPANEAPPAQEFDCESAEEMSYEQAKALVLACGGCQHVPFTVAVIVGWECVADTCGDGRPRLPEPLDVAQNSCSGIGHEGP